eukprot:TRINITY_DN56_c0_g4_i1.p1 TRINITY_DN56_c0_g4~~TRINITY_DN56_c0_g4_i1.p1  ORF type:complete len:479 (+),score=179.22 TRINITY_DN56_c0_g4_i1:168-1439(+)
MASWAVLIVGGTPGETHGIEKRPWADPGQQVSFFETLGAVYQQMEQRLGRDRVIVMAGLGWVLQWLDEAAVLGHPPCLPEHLEHCLEFNKVTDPAKREAKREFYRERAAKVRRACAVLLRNGGADYDNDRLDPETVTNVLAGEAMGERDRVVPKEGVRSNFVWFTTHGGYHAVSVGHEPNEEGESKPTRIDPLDRICDVCHQPHVLTEDEAENKRRYDHEHSSLRTLEWFMLFPQRAKSLAKYGCVTTAGRDMTPPDFMDSTQHTKLSPLTCLYWQQVFSAISDGCIQGRDTVLLYQFCTSGGHCKWLEDERYAAHFNVKQWPIFQMATSKEQQYSLGGTFTMIFLEALAAGVDRNATLREVWREAEARYWDTHRLEQQMNAASASPSSRFGEITYSEGTLSDIGDRPARNIFCNAASPTSRI